MCAEKLAKSAESQQEAAANRNGTHKCGTFTSSVGVKQFTGDVVNEFLCLGFCRASLWERVRLLSEAALSPRWFSGGLCGFCSLYCSENFPLFKNIIGTC